MPVRNFCSTETLIDIAVTTKTPLKGRGFLYKIDEKTGDDEIRKMFEKALMTMLNGNAEDVFCGLAVLYFQIFRESSDRSPFQVNRALLLKKAKEEIRKKEKNFVQIEKWGGEKSSEGLWKEVQRYRRLFFSKFGISI